MTPVMRAICSTATPLRTLFATRQPAVRAAVRAMASQPSGSSATPLCSRPVVVRREAGLFKTPVRQDGSWSFNHLEERQLPSESEIRAFLRRCSHSSMVLFPWNIDLAAKKLAGEKLSESMIPTQVAHGLGETVNDIYSWQKIVRNISLAVVAMGRGEQPETVKDRWDRLDVPTLVFRQGVFATDYAALHHNGVDFIGGPKIEKSRLTCNVLVGNNVMQLVESRAFKEGVAPRIISKSQEELEKAVGDLREGRYSIVIIR